MPEIPITPLSATAANEDVARTEFATFAELRRLFGIPRSSAYELAAAGEIRFARMRKRGNVSGRVLVDCDSVREYLRRCTTPMVGSNGGAAK